MPLDYGIWLENTDGYGDTPYNIIGSANATNTTIFASKLTILSLLRAVKIHAQF